MEEQNSQLTPSEAEHKGARCQPWSKVWRCHPKPEGTDQTRNQRAVATGHKERCLDLTGLLKLKQAATPQALAPTNNTPEIHKLENHAQRYHENVHKI